MGIKLGPHIKRYKDIAVLLFKYGSSDLVKDAGLDEALDDSYGYSRDASGRARELNSNGGAPGNGKVAERNAGNGKSSGAASATVAGAPVSAADAFSVAGKPCEARAQEKELCEQLADDIEKLGPAFVKFGQLLSTRSDLLPPKYLDALSRLQDKCEPVPFAEIEKRVTEELGVRISKAFKEFDSEPIAAASLAQIHRAIMRDGRQVAVKVQRPGIRESILEDLQILTEIADFYDKNTKVGSKYEFGNMLEEFRKSVLAELDYRKEAHNLETLRANLKELELIVVPAPIHDYSSSTVLTMDFICGKKVTDITRLELLELDGAPLAEEVFKAYLKQILVDGFFHADPHPGNVFLTDKKRIALIDLGMVARLSPHLQGKLLQMVIAISEGHPDAVANIAFDIGEQKADYDELAFRKRIAELVQTDLTNTDIEGMQIGKVVLGVQKAAAECGIRVPSELTMVGKALMNLDQVGRTLDPKFEPNKSVQRNAAHIMHQRMLQDLSPGQIANNLIEAKDFLQGLPKNVNRIFDLVSSNKLSVKVLDERLLVDSAQKVANRISLSLILASLVVGASLMMRVPTTFTILGYPGVAMICFLFAATGAFAMAIQIAFYDQKPQKLKEDSTLNS